MTTCPWYDVLGAIRHVVIVSWHCTRSMGLDEHKAHPATMGPQRSSTGTGLLQLSAAMVALGAWQVLLLTA